MEDFFVKNEGDPQINSIVKAIVVEKYMIENSVSPTAFKRLFNKNISPDEVYLALVYRRPKLSSEFITKAVEDYRQYLYKHSTKSQSLEDKLLTQIKTEIPYTTVLCLLSIVFSYLSIEDSDVNSLPNGISFYLTISNIYGLSKLESRLKVLKKLRQDLRRLEANLKL